MQMLEREYYLAAPEVHQKKDGPMLFWAGKSHFLTRWEQFRLFCGFTSLERLADEHFQRRWVLTHIFGESR